MAYSQAQVVVGGLSHIPVLIGMLWMFDRRNNRGKMQTLSRTKSQVKEKEEVSAPKVEVSVENLVEEKITGSEQIELITEIGEATANEIVSEEIKEEVIEGEEEKEKTPQLEVEIQPDEQSKNND